MDVRLSILRNLNPTPLVGLTHLKMYMIPITPWAGLTSAHLRWERFS
jgi:hypothetical protein